MRKRGVDWKFVLVVLLVVNVVLPGRVLADAPFSLHLPLVFGERASEGSIEAAPGQVIPDIQGITQYQQNDDRWKCDQLGTCNAALNPPPNGQESICSSDGMCAEGEEDVVTTIGSDGCVVASLAMVYSYYGGTMNPSELNQCLTNSGGYSYNGNCGDCYFLFDNTSCAPAGVTISKVADVSDVDSELRRGFPVISKLSDRQHYVVLIGRNEGGSYRVYDPQKNEVVSVSKNALDLRDLYSFRGPLPPPSDVPQPIGPSGGMEVENRDPTRFTWIDGFDFYDIQLDVAPWHDNACWPRERWSTAFNITGSSMDLYDFEDPEHLLFLTDGEYWWRIRGYRGGNPSDWSGWQHFLLVNCSPPFTWGSRTEGGVTSQEQFCPSNPVATPTPEPTSVPPAATTIPFGKPQLVSPADGAEFNSGERVVLQWSCPGGRAWSKVVVEREGEVYDSGWTKAFTWESPINNFGEVKWKAIAKKGDGELSQWSDEWTYRIQGGSGIPPRLIDPTKGAVFQCGNDVLFHWECRSFECQIKTWHPDFDTHYTGWTKWNWWRVEAIHVHPGTNYWAAKGRDEQGRETDWTQAWAFTIQGCTSTPVPSPVATVTRTATRTATVTATWTPTSVPTDTLVPTATETPSPTITTTLVPTSTSVPTATAEPEPTRTQCCPTPATPFPTSTDYPPGYPSPTPPIP